MSKTLVVAFACVAFVAVTSADAGWQLNGWDQNGWGQNGWNPNGWDQNGWNQNGWDQNGWDQNGWAQNGISSGLTKLQHSLLFGNTAVHAALMNNALTREFLTDSTTNPANPLHGVWFDPNSVTILSYIWADMHPGPDPSQAPDFLNDPNVLDITSPANGSRIRFWGHLGICAQSLQANLPLASDLACQHWLSAALLAQQNPSGIHNILGNNGPSSATGQFIGNQLTAGSAFVPAFPYSYGTHTAVDSVTLPCAPGTTGPAACSWIPGFDGVCSPFDVFKLQLAAGTNPSNVGIMVQVQQGIHARDYPFNPGGLGAADGDFLGASVSGETYPSVTFACPPSGTFSTQWAPFDRDLQAQTGTVGSPLSFVASLVKANGPAPSIEYPANEVHVFRRENREGYWSGNLFGRNNVTPAVFACEARPVLTCNGPGPCQPELCDASVTDSCVSCQLDGAVDFATLPDARQVAASDVTIGTFSPTSIAGDQWAAAGVHFNGTGFLFEMSTIADGKSTHPDGWCPGGGYTCASNVVLASASGVGTVFDTLRVNFDVPQTTVRLDIDGAYLCDSTSFNLTLKSNSGVVGTVTLTAADEIAACATSQSTFQTCGRFAVSAPSFQAFDEIDIAPTTCVGAATQCTVASGNTDQNPACGGVLIDNLSFASPLFQKGSRTVVFPNANFWLSSFWDAVKAYPAFRACSLDGSTCVANYQGTIDSNSAPCSNQDIDVDSTSPLPYTGAAHPLFDVGGCFFNNTGAGSGPTPAVFVDNGTVTPAYGLTTFFAKHGVGVDGVDVTCSPTNQAPTASAVACDASGACGASLTVCGGAQVTLDASGSSDPGGDPLSFAWTELNNVVPPSVSSNATYPFTAPQPSLAPQTLSFNLTAADSCNLVDHKTVNVTVKHANQAPVAMINGGDVTVKVAGVATLDGSASFDPDGANDSSDGALLYQWTQTGFGTPVAVAPVALSDATAQKPTFVAPDPFHGGNPGLSTTLTFQLTVTDQPNGTLECGGPLSSAPVTVKVIIKNVDQPPVAVAGVFNHAGNTFVSNSTVTLDGSASHDPDGDAITYAWTQLSGTTVALSAANAARPSFTAPSEPALSQETLRFQLIVTDQWGLASAPATVDIVVQDPYAAPDCSHGAAKVASLWPPDHSMVAESIVGVNDPDSHITQVFISITGITQDEPVTGGGSGSTAVDAQINPDGTFLLRAERAASGDGRVYHVAYTAADGFGGTCSGVVTVCVPIDQGNAKTCIDEGPLYDSTK